MDAPQLIRHQDTDPDCQQPCDADCEIGPVHCYWAHEPNFKKGWHDARACDEKAAVWR